MRRFEWLELPYYVVLNGAVIRRNRIYRTPVLTVKVNYHTVIAKNVNTVDY
jgi:hypothetical protein